LDTSVKAKQLTDKKEYISSNADTLLLSAGLLAVSYFINGLPALRMAAVCLISGAISEYICFSVILKKKTFNDLGAFASSLLIAMLLPASAPLYIGALASAFAIWVAKLPFGDGRSTPFLPAAAGFCFIAMLFPAETFGYASTTPLLDMLAEGNSVKLNLIGFSRLMTGYYPGAIGTAVPGALAGVFLDRLIRKP
jgi:Na+-translocating ferredoxin:NAD+ oxidoreductase RnfD subunit